MELVNIDIKLCGEDSNFSLNENLLLENFEQLIGKDLNASVSKLLWPKPVSMGFIDVVITLALMSGYDIAKNSLPILWRAIRAIQNDNPETNIQVSFVSNTAENPEVVRIDGYDVGEDKLEEMVAALNRLADEAKEG